MEAIVTVYGPATLPGEEGRDLMEMREDEERMERLLRIMRASEKWFREACPICESYLQHSYQKPPTIVNVPKITFAMIPCPWGKYGILPSLFHSNSLVEQWIHREHCRWIQGAKG
jgi:thiaminase